MPPSFNPKSLLLIVYESMMCVDFYTQAFGREVQGKQEGKGWDGEEAAGARGEDGAAEKTPANRQWSQEQTQAGDLTPYSWEHGVCLCIPDNFLKLVLSVARLRFRYIFCSQDFEEQLDMKDRIIKRLQDQIKALQAPVKGKMQIWQTGICWPGLTFITCPLFS